MMLGRKNLFTAKLRRYLRAQSNVHVGPGPTVIEVSNCLRLNFPERRRWLEQLTTLGFRD